MINVDVTNFSSGTGYIDPLAVIGNPPEHRDFRDDPSGGYAPTIEDSARIEAFVTVDAGTRVPTRIGARTWLMKHVHIGHDAFIGDDCELSPGAVVCGHAILADGVRMGVNSCILPFRRAGKGARIGAGAVVTHDIPAGEVWVGNPARKLEKETS